MSKEFSEDKLIQASAAELLEKELGWTAVYAFDEVLGLDGTLGRTSYKQVLLPRRFAQALKSLNPWMTGQQVTEAIERMTEDMSSQTLMQINEHKYQYIRDGVPVTRVKPGGEPEEVRAKVIDFASPGKNDFLCVRELWVQGALYKHRADIVGFVNGLPLLFVELKNHDVAVEDAFNKNYRDYLDTIPQLFYHNAMVMFSNGLEARVGTIDSKWEFFHEWKRLTEEDAGNIELPTMLRGICKKENFLDLLENFILYDHSGGSTVKILARNHQYLGVNQAVEKYRNREISQGKLGVFWHTRGSGKSYSMLFLTQKIRRKFEGSPTIIVLTDRDELNKQISETFENCGLLGKSKSKEFMAQSAENLINKLRGNPSFVFSLIQKFNDTAAKAKPIYPDHDITPERKQAKDAIEAIYKELQKKRKHADITDLSVAINEIIDEHLEVEAGHGVLGESRRFDISRIDFDLLQREFAKAKQKNLLLKDIQERLQERLAEMLAQNPSRINFYERYQEIIESYNQEQDRASIEKIFEELMNLSKQLSEEEWHYVREGFDNDEQLSMYDLLMKDNLTKAEIKRIKEVAVELLEKIKSQLATMDHPFEKRETKAAIIITIRDTLWEMLPESYSDESIDTYNDAVFEYVQQRYGGVA